MKKIFFKSIWSCHESAYLCRWGTVQRYFKSWGIPKYWTGDAAVCDLLYITLTFCKICYLCTICWWKGWTLLQFNVYSIHWDTLYHLILKHVLLKSFPMLRSRFLECMYIILTHHDIWLHLINQINVWCNRVIWISIYTILFL